MSTGSDRRKAAHVVVDSAVFLRPCRIEDFGENIYTVQAVVDEIRDKDARRRLSVLPYELIFKEPDSDSLQIMTDFAKKTGDYPVLSATDIRLLALTHTLHREHCGVEGLRMEPVRNVQVTKKSNHIPVDSMPGFYRPKKQAEVERGEGDDDSQKPVAVDEEQEEEQVSSDVREERKDEDTAIEDLRLIEESVVEEEEDETAECESDAESDEDDGEGWITPSNIKQITAPRLDDEKGAQPIVVACLTTDFAMQNVLKQMNLPVMGVDGVVIRHIRTYLLRCFACFKTTSDMSRKFCHACGNKTLKRVGVTVLPDGTKKIHISKRPLNLRGLKFSLPLPIGGKHAHNPIVADGQREPHQRPSKKALQKLNALDPEFVARDSPFAVNDVYSRAAQHGYIRNGTGPGHFNKRNPNESHNPSRRRKKVSGF